MESVGIKFKVNLGEETRPIIERIIFPIEENQSIFSEQYKKAFEEIENYLSLRLKENDKILQVKQNEQINNIMAFVGERGSGKTSCMLSVANALEYKSQNSFGEYSQIAHTCFHSIDLIDPSFFDEKSNVLNIIIAKLFRKFKKKEEEVHCSDKSRFDKKQNLVEMFQRVQASLNCVIWGKQHSEDDLEQLIDLSASVNLCDDIQDLVNSYLEYMYTKEDVLIIMVDDIDLNTQHAHIMAEQIRKYFIHPNVIILIAVKIDQLANVMKRQYTEEFKCLLGKQMTLESIDEMVDRYLNKLIPHPQRIFLPDLEAFLESPLTIIHPKDSKGEEIRPFNTIREAVPMLIFEKTRYLFYNSLGVTSYIVPRNLRELRHIINLLWNMKTYTKEVKTEYNKVLFRKYFYETWTSNNLDTEGQEMIKNILKITDAVLINKSVIGLLKERFENVTKQYPNSTELGMILSENNMTYNISIGDVMGLIYHLENVTEKVEDQKLLFMIKSIYSIKLYEYYDQTTEKQLNKVNLEKEVRKNDHLKNRSNYQKLAGGSFINATLASLLPESRGTGIVESRSRRVINAKIFYTLLNHVINKKESDAIVIIGVKIDYKTAMNIVEFFALTISYLRDSKYQHRVKPEVYYNEELKNQNYENLCFDIASYTYNLVFIEDSYSRFHPELFSICNSNKSSLFNSINNKIKGRHSADRHSWMSWICIRNAEVLQDFVLYLENKKPKGASNSLEVIKNFFDSASEFKILSYDFNEDYNEENNKEDNHHNINFAFLSEISNVLNEINPIFFESIFTNPKKSTKSLSAISININLGLKKKSQYAKESIWSKLIGKKQNLYLKDNDMYRKIFDDLFDQGKYAHSDAIQILKQYKQRVESL